MQRQGFCQQRGIVGEHPDPRPATDLARDRENLGDRLERQRDAKARRKHQLDNQNPFQILHAARVPETPTDPNITLVALSGSAVGLALAIALILAMDVLRSTFKTGDDVSGLQPLPVLGGMS